ncbi:acetyltransferase component of pyruvate dehydrogenase complex [Methylopila jiangsuensis]|uniref:Acetyltransferase component of pyruvate dehydrogenase complex n=1 Tax=Methylopila jiangsuensis TaxID=586230 RepID=A0A9W6N2T7_9HYPH|nr:pyruvate dehydrogenase complex dihydrolipoamide acetyltransferase [Methylopila jiangsuensis]MDR6285793.1 pyruvate dehydrogenase E2 component (dihydrolipoamide acetyltransferase) [Methylopila jiangsuensis]GLK75551.1 acetyltransferase component of pyruvate dehydrogenase complex [Methylopila jiangsuensis]
MPTNILMPALSPTMEKGNLAKWLVKEGDAVKSGDVIAEIETDKATMEVEAVDEGVVGRIVVPEGTSDVPVNELIAILLEEGEDESALKDAGSKPKAEPAKAEKTDEAKSDAAPKSEAAPKTEAKAEPKPAANGHDASRDKGERVFASPLARRIARDAGLDLKAISGSGPHGRVVKADVEQAKASGGGKAAPAKTDAKAPDAAPSAKSPAPSLPSDEAIKKLFPEGSYEEIPHDGMRKTIARRMTEARQTIPQFYVTVDCEIDALLGLREQINASAPEKDGKPVWKVSVNDMVVKALGVALSQVPDANVSWTETAMLRHKHADVGVAVALPGNGLITPIIRAVETKTLSVIAKEMKDFAARARDRKLKPEEYQGGTTAVSNLGMFGVKDFTAVVNPPHSTILAVGGAEKRPVVKGDEIRIATVMSLTLTCDHRSVDGALGATLISAVKRLIEKPMGLLV